MEILQKLVFKATQPEHLPGVMIILLGCPLAALIALLVTGSRLVASVDYLVMMAIGVGFFYARTLSHERVQREKQAKGNAGEFSF